MVAFAGKTLALPIAFLVFNFCMMSTFAADDKEEKHDYNIEVTKVTQQSKSQVWFTSDTFCTAKYFTEDSMGLDAILDTKKDFPDDMLISLVVSQQDPKTNQWTEKIRQSHTFCDYIENNSFFVNNVYKNSDFPKACPITKGKYFITEMTVGNAEFPKHLEESKWKAEIQLIIKDTKESILKFTVDVDIVPIDEDEDE